MKKWQLILLASFVFSSTLATAYQEPICDVTKDPDVKYFDIRLPEMAVPDSLTTYTCQDQKIPLPMDVDYHAVAFQPIIANKQIMHHMILFGCMYSKSDNPHNCSDLDGSCRSFLVQWSMGIEGQICSHPDTGVRFGLHAYKTMALQIHWNNAQLTQGMTDSSGVRVYYTTRLRKYDVGNIQVGQNELMIPPEVAGFSQTGSCSSDCTRRWLARPIYLTRAHIHLHYVGDGGVLELLRNGKKIQTVVEDPEFDYNNPPVHYFNDPVKVLPGDELKLTCIYNTRDGNKHRNQTIYWGIGSDGEMCYAFITYYPAVPDFDQCVQSGDHDICLPSRRH